MSIEQGGYTPPEAAATPPSAALEVANELSDLVTPANETKPPSYFVTKAVDQGHFTKDGEVSFEETREIVLSPEITFADYLETLPPVEVLAQRLEYLEENGVQFAALSYDEELTRDQAVGLKTDTILGSCLLPKKPQRQMIKGALAEQWNLQQTTYGEWPVTMYNNRRLHRLEFFKPGQQRELLDTRWANHKPAAEAPAQPDAKPDIQETLPQVVPPVENISTLPLERELGLRREIDALTAQNKMKREESEYWKAVALRREEQLRAPKGRIYIKFVDSNGHAVRTHGNFPPDSAYTVSTSDDGRDHIMIFEINNLNKPPLDIVLDHNHPISMKELHDITRAWFLSDKPGQTGA